MVTFKTGSEDNATLILPKVDMKSLINSVCEACKAILDIYTNFDENKSNGYDDFQNLLADGDLKFMVKLYSFCIFYFYHYYKIRKVAKASQELLLIFSSTLSCTCGLYFMTLAGFAIDTFYNQNKTYLFI
ncbi:hypothetical protein GQX74_014816 [Glossina fuscipes]|nr:hypothetical protein GQX74_014816 [Glossina fuscipes]